MRDRSDFEKAIMQLWGTKEDLMLLGERYLDHPEHMTEDEVANAIYGIAAVHELRLEKLFQVYKQFFKLDEWKWLNDGYEGDEE